MKEWLPAIAQHKQTKLYKAGEVVFAEDSEVTGIYFVISGAVKVHKHWGNEKELILRFAKSGDIFGHRGLGKDSIYPITATVIEPAKICFVPLAFFQSSLKVNTEALYQLLLFYASELQESEKKMRDLAHMPVKGRMIQALLFLKTKFGIDAEGCINLTLSRQDLASFVGSSYETIFRFLAELTAEKMIKISGKKIRLLKENGLKDKMVLMEPQKN